MLRPISALALALATSCTSTLTIEEMDAELGPRPSGEEMQETARSRVLDGMFDPQSALFYWEEPFQVYKGHVPGNLVEGSRVGWSFPFWVNGKNRLGGYVGKQKYFIMFTKDNNYLYEAALLEGFRTIQLEDPVQPFAGVAITLEDKLDQLEPGMTVSEVLSIMGEPTTDHRAAGGRSLLFTGKNGATSVSASLTFIDDELQPFN